MKDDNYRERKKEIQWIPDNIMKEGRKEERKEGRKEVSDMLVT